MSIAKYLNKLKIFKIQPEKENYEIDLTLCH